MRSRGAWKWAVLLGAALAATSDARAEAIVNGTFDVNVDGWIDPGALPGTEFGWTGFDPHDDPLSGSMYVWTNLPEAGLDGPWQCVPAVPGPHTLTAAAYVTIPAEHIDPFVEMALDTFATPDCTGGETASAYDVALNYYQVWETLSAQIDAPPGTQSARVRFLVGGTYDTWTDVVNIDDVSLVPEPAASALSGLALVTLAGRARRRLRAAP